MNDKDIIQLYLNRDQRALSATAKKYGKYCTSTVSYTHLTLPTILRV